MTVLDRRWWAPEAPGIGPDEFDLTLLEVGDDAPRDLAQAFLAIHRVGAAACEAVATQPLADESTLAFALANARKLVAPEAAEIVAKSVGEDENYGNLLLRDLLDDAEATSLSLWRSCIAKGVPAPMAAQRIGMIYGLPAGEIYKFQKLATDPRAQPLALIDAADRSLFGYADKLVTDEAVERKVEIAKAPRPERARRVDFTPDDPATPFYDARDATGEFAVTPAEAPVRRPRARPTRAKRAVRPASRAQMAAGTMRAAGMSATGMTAAQLHAARMSLGGKLGKLADPDKGLATAKPTAAGTERDPGDVTAPMRDTREFAEYVPTQLAFVLPTAEFREFVSAAPRGEFGPVFRAGHLERYAGGGPDVFTSDSDEEAAEHQRMVRQVVEMIRSRQPQSSEQTKNLDRAVFESADNPEQELNNQKSIFLSELGLSPEQIAREIAHVDHGLNFDNPNQELTLVYFPPGEERRHIASRPKVEITEAIMIDDDLLGHNEAPQGSPAQWTLEKNQPMTFTTLGVGGPLGKRFWDPSLRAFRTWRFARPTDEEDITNVHKALSPERFHQLEAAGVYQRDAEGQFTDTEGAPLVAVPTKVARQRPQRARRAIRPEGMTARGLTAGGMAAGGMRAQLDPAQMKLERMKLVMEAKHDEPAKHRAYDVLELPSDGLYVVPPPAVDNNDPTIRAEFQPYKPGWKTRQWLIQQGLHSGQGAELEAMQLHKLRQETWRPLNNEQQIYPTLRNQSPEDFEAIAHKIYAAMKGDHTFTAAIIEMRINEDNTADVTVKRNAYALGVRNVVKVPFETKLDLPLELRPLHTGQFQTPETIRAFMLEQYHSARAAQLNYDRDVIANPWVHVWEAHNRNKR